MSEKRSHRVYSEEFKRQAAELLINSGKPQAQLARELGCSDMSLSGWKRKYLKSLAPVKLEGGPQEPEELVATIKQQVNKTKRFPCPFFRGKYTRPIYAGSQHKLKDNEI